MGMGHEQQPEQGAGGKSEGGFWDQVFESNGALTGLHAGIETVLGHGHDVGHMFQSLSGGANGMQMAGAVLAPFSIMSGIHELRKGKDGSGPDAVLDMLGGGAEVIEGVENLLPLVGYSNPIGVAAQGFSQGLKTGRAGDEGFKGLLGKDEKGKDRSYTDWSADRAAEKDHAARHAAFQFATKKLGLGERTADIASSVVGGAVGVGETVKNTIGGALPVAAMGVWQRVKSLFSSSDEGRK
jgi:hypothetical protein